MAVELYMCVRSGRSSAEFRLGGCPPAPHVPPAPLAHILALMAGDLVPLDDATIERLLVAFDLPRADADDLADPVELWHFLWEYAGQEAALREDAAAESPVADAAVAAGPVVDAAFAAGPVADAAVAADPGAAEPSMVGAGEMESAGAVEADDGEAGHPSLWETAAGVATWRSHRWRELPFVVDARPMRTSLLQRLFGSVRRRAGLAA